MALTTVMPTAQRRWDLAVPAAMAVAAALVSMGVTTALHLPVIGYANYLLVWGSIHQWGFAWRDGIPTRPRWRPYALAAGGAALLAGLVTSGAFPAGMVDGNAGPAVDCAARLRRRPGRARIAGQAAVALWCTLRRPPPRFR